MWNKDNAHVIKEEYERHGAVGSQLSSKMYEITEEMFKDGSMARLVGEYEDEKAAEVAMKLRKEREASERTLSEVVNATWSIRGEAAKITVTEKTMLESLNVYSDVLRRTYDIIGDDMSEAIWLKTIEAASYGMWRAIMGPKFDEKPSRR